MQDNNNNLAVVIATMDNLKDSARTMTTMLQALATDVAILRADLNNLRDHVKDIDELEIRAAILEERLSTLTESYKAFLKDQEKRVSTLAPDSKGWFLTVAGYWKEILVVAIPVIGTVLGAILAGGINETKIEPKAEPTPTEDPWQLPENLPSNFNSTAP